MKIFLKNAYQVLSEMVNRYFVDKVGRSAAALAYYLLFSVFPLLVFVNAAIGLLDLSTADIIAKLDRMLPQQVLEIFTEYLSHIADYKSQTILYVGIVLLIYFVSKAVRALMQAVTTAYRMEGQAGWFSLVFGVVFSFLIQLSVVILLAVMLLGNNFLGFIGEYINISPAFYKLWGIIRFAIAPVFTFVVLASFYHIVSRGKYSFKSVLPGAAFSFFVWIATSMAFSYYVSGISKYSLLYGSLGAIMILMLWLYITGTVLILGGELNHILICRKEKEIKK